MRSFPVRRWSASGFVLLVLLTIGATGCRKPSAMLVCGDKTVDVDPSNNGARPQAVYVCEDNTVTWQPNGHTFTVEFKKESPFKDGGKTFDNGHNKSGKTKHHDHLIVYEYRITVDNTSYDPQVIGGGDTP